MDKPPSYGRVHGIRDGASWKTCYPEGPEDRRKRQLVVTQESINEKVAIAINKTKAETKEELVDVVSGLVTNAVASLILAIFNWSKSNPNAQPEDYPILSFVGSNSANTITPTPAQAIAKGPVLVHSSPTSVSGMLGGPSSLAALDALTIIMRHTLFTSMSVVFRFSCLSAV